MKKLDIYIIRKFLGTFFYSIFLLTIVVVIFDVSEKIDDFLEKNAPLREIIFTYYLNFIPYFINLFSPLFTFIAVIFFTSKMATHTEIIAILGNGISFRRMLKPYLVSSVFLAVMSFYLQNFLIPYTNRNMLAFEKAYIKNPTSRKDIDIHMQISPGTFIYMESYNDRTKQGYKFCLEKIRGQVMTYKLLSETVRWDSLKNSWCLDDAFLRTLDGRKESLKRIPRMDTVFGFRPADFVRSVEEVKVMNWFQLRRFIKQERMRGLGDVVSYEVEKQKRIAFPFATVVLTFIGVALSSRKVRGGIGIHLGIGITISFAFILFMQVSTTFAIYGNLPPLIAVWIPNLIFGALGAYLVKTAPK